MAAQPNDFVVFDVETQHSFEEVGGRENLADLKISVAVSYDSRTEACHVFRESELGLLVQQLSRSALVVGFNLLQFDYPVLQPYTDVRLRDLPTLDLMHWIMQKHGVRIGLNNLARATLGAPKGGHGLDAIRWYREGDWDRLIQYCEKDVLLTRDLYLFGKQHGYVKFWDRDRRAERQLEVQW